MSSILKVDEIQDTSGNNIINENAGTITVGKAGNTTNIVGTLQNDGAALVTGKLLQVVQSITNTNISTTSTTYQDVLTANITPSSTSSKILILTNVPCRKEDSAAGNNAVGLRILRDATVLNTFGQYIAWNDNNTVFEQETGSFDYLDSPNSTSQITYKTQFRSMTGGQVAVCHDTSGASLTLMEIAG